MFRFKKQWDWPYTIDFNNDELKRYVNWFSEKNLENFIKTIDIYYSISIKSEIENRIDNRPNDPEFELKMQGLLGFRKWLKWHFNEKSIANA
jgi:hypothetical protein